MYGCIIIIVNLLIILITIFCPVDKKIFRAVKSPRDCFLLQYDIDSIRD
jgi:hypothetical protein